MGLRMFRRAKVDAKFLDAQFLKRCHVRRMYNNFDCIAAGPPAGSWHLGCNFLSLAGVGCDIILGNAERFHLRHYFW